MASLPPYQLVPVEPGKWYVSDNGPTKTNPPLKPHPGRDDSRVAGPCDSEAEAEAKWQGFIDADRT